MLVVHRGEQRLALPRGRGCLCFFLLGGWYGVVWMLINQDGSIESGRFTPIQFQPPHPPSINRQTKNNPAKKPKTEPAPKKRTAERLEEGGQRKHVRLVLVVQLVKHLCAVWRRCVWRVCAVVVGRSVGRRCRGWNHCQLDHAQPRPVVWRLFCQCSRQ